MRIRLMRLGMILAIVAGGSSLVTTPAMASLPRENPPCGDVDHSFELKMDQNCATGYRAIKAGIIIDLGGKRLTGDRTGTTIGVSANGLKNVIIRHGAIVEFGTGVVAD